MDLLTLDDLFTKRLFRIPDYQRGYAWTNKELDEFWEDLVNIPENKQNDSNKEIYHYTGMITVTKVDLSTKKEIGKWNDEQWLIKNKKYIPYYIVDGQQRLTTCIIFIKSFIDLIIKQDKYSNKNHEDIYINSNSLKSIIEQYICEKEPENKVITTFKFGYDKNNPSFEYLKTNILSQDDNKNTKEDYYTKNLQNALDFFNSNLLDYSEHHSEEELFALFNKIVNRLKFNYYELNNDFDVFVAFETMNNRGKALSKLELLKNRLIYLVNLYSCDDETKNSLRETINKEWQNIYSNLGKNKDKLLDADEFLKAHWITYFKFSRNKGDDYIDYLLKKKFIPKNITKSYIQAKNNNVDIREELIENEDVDESQDENIEDDSLEESTKLSLADIQNFVKSIGNASKYWFAIKCPDLGEKEDNKIITEDEAKWLSKLNRVGIAYFRPLILASFMNNQIDDTARIKLLKSIERFIFLVFRTGKALSNYKSSKFQSEAKLLCDNKKSIDEFCNDLNKITDEWLMKNGIFNYQPFKNYITRLYNDNKGFYGWSDLKYFLYEYECETVENNGNPKIDWNIFIQKNKKDHFSIEHIYPQTPDDEYWHRMFKDYNDDEIKYLTNSLGNLLPLSQSINSEIQNKKYSNKKERFSKSSYSSIEVSQDYTDWNPNNIKDRGIKLLNFMEKRWNIKFENEDAKLDLLHIPFCKNK